MHWISKATFVLHGGFFLYLHVNLCASKSLHVYTSFRLFTDGEYKSERLNGKEDGLSLKQRAMEVLTSLSGSVGVHACVFINKR